MKKTVAFALLALSLSACAEFMPAPKYTYQYRLKTPPSADMSWSDASSQWTFNIEEKMISFSLENKSDSTMKVIWDDASLVQFGKALRVIHDGVKLADRNSPQAPTVIPPASRIDDLVIPAENVDWVGSDWYESDLYPTTATAGKEGDLQQFKGDVLTLRIPVERDGKRKEYVFEFEVANVIAPVAPAKPASAVPANRRR